MDDVVAALPGAGPFALFTVAVSVIAGIVAIVGRRASADLDRLRTILDEQAEDKAALRVELDAARAREDRTLTEKDRLIDELDRARWELSSSRSEKHAADEMVTALRAEKAALAETAALAAARTLHVEQAMRALEDSVGVKHRRAVDGIQ